MVGVLLLKTLYLGGLKADSSATLNRDIEEQRKCIRIDF